MLGLKGRLEVVCKFAVFVGDEEDLVGETREGGVGPGEGGGVVDDGG